MVKKLTDKEKFDLKYFAIFTCNKNAPKVSYRVSTIKDLRRKTD